MNKACPNCNYVHKKGRRCDMCGAINGWYPFELAALSFIIFLLGTPSLGCVSLLGFTSYTMVQQANMTATAQARQTATSVGGTAIAYQQATATTEIQLKQTATSEAIATAEAQATITAEFQAEQTAEAQATMTAEFQAEQTAEAQTTMTAEFQAQQTVEAQATMTAEFQAQQTVEAQATMTAEFQAQQTAEAQATMTAEFQAQQTATAEAEAKATAQAQQATATAKARTEYKNVTVDGKQDWQSSDIFVQKGDGVTISYLSGKWSIDPKNFAYTDANGVNFGANAGNGMLLAKIGEGSSWKIGNFAEFTALQDGFLYQVMKDCYNCYRDNDGAIQVQIEVRHVGNIIRPLAPTATPHIESKPVVVEAKPQPQPAQSNKSSNLKTMNFGGNLHGSINSKGDEWYTFTGRQGDTTIFFMYDPHVSLQDIGLVIYDQNNLPHWPPDEPDKLVNLGVGGAVSEDRDGDGGTGEMIWRGSLLGDTRYYVRLFNRSGATVKYCITFKELFAASCFK